jgi:site-specific recombinase XerD
MAYADKRDGKLTGSWVGEAPKLHKKRRFKTKQAAEDYETFTRMMGREPPTVDDGLESTGAPTFSDAVKIAKAMGGPKGKWKRQRDPALMQRIDFCDNVIGPYELHRVTYSVLEKITAQLDKHVAPGKRSHDATRKGLSNATKNRYLAAAGTVLTCAVIKGLITTRPMVPLLDEKSDRRHRDIMQVGQEEVVLRLMREAGHELEALCVEVFVETGLRQGELQKLNPDQITLEQVEHEGGTDEVGLLTLRAGQTKNDTCRVVILSADLAKQIKAVIAAGNLPDAASVLDTFKEACNRAGYTGNLVIHSLRHTRNTRMRKAGINQRLRKQMLGHMSDAANDIYDHVDLEDQLEAVKLVREYAGKRAAKLAGAPSQVIDFPKAGAG